jgi:copper transport protein
MRRVLGIGLAAALLWPSSAFAHASLERSDPVAGAHLGASPSVVRLTFSERPDPALSRIEVVDAAGRARQKGRPAAVAGDPATLAAAVPPLPRGSYTVRYRVIAADDGHATAGTLTFGIRAAAGAAVAAPQRPSSLPEVVARTGFIVGLVLVLGAVAAALGGFGGSRDLRLAAAGWTLAAGALALLAEAQRRAAETGLDTLLDSSAGRGLLFRATALLGCGAALWLARHPPRRTLSLLIAGAAALGAIEAHVAAGHAATSPARVAFQLAHFGAAGVWIGGLVALLLGTRSALAARRFSTLAGGAFAVVIVTGALRAGEELPAPSELFTSAYGRMILIKVALVVPLAALALRNRRAVRARRLGSLARTGRAELAVAAAALLSAGALGALAPPVVVGAAGPRGLLAEGHAGATAVRLTTVSPEPGPNRFVLRVDAGAPPAAATLRFTPIDDAGVRPTTLRLRRESRDTYAAAGANLAFDGRWRVSVRLGDGTTIPLELDAQGPRQFLSVLRPPGRPPQYTHLIPRIGLLRLTPDHARGRVDIRAFDLFSSEARVETLVLTHTRHGSTRAVPVRRVGRGHYAARLPIGRGDRLAVIAHLRGGERARSVFDLSA